MHFAKGRRSCLKKKKIYSMKITGRSWQHKYQSFLFNLACAGPTSSTLHFCIDFKLNFGWLRDFLLILTQKLKSKTGEMIPALFIHCFFILSGSLEYFPRMSWKFCWKTNKNQFSQSQLSEPWNAVGCSISSSRNCSLEYSIKKFLILTQQRTNHFL